MQHDHRADVLARRARERRCEELDEDRGGRVAEPTVDYYCLWENVYREMGEEPPEGARPLADGAAIQAWFDALPARRKGIVKRLIGL